MTRWNLNVPDETDRDVRMLLGRRGFKKGDLSRFVIDAVRREVLRAAIEETRERFEDLTPKQADRLADEAVENARADRS